MANLFLSRTTICMTGSTPTRFKRTQLLQLDILTTGQNFFQISSCFHCFHTLSILSLALGQGKNEFAALPGLRTGAFCPNSPTVTLDNLPADERSQTCSFSLGMSCYPTIELLEYLGQILL